MPSINQQIVERLAAALMGVSAAEDRVERERVVPIERDETPCITVKRGREPKEPAGSTADMAELMVDVRIYVRGDPWTDAADAIAMPVHRAIVSDPQLASLVRSIRHSNSEWDDHDADETAGCLTLEYKFRYTVSGSDISNSTIL